MSQGGLMRRGAGRRGGAAAGWQFTGFQAAQDGWFLDTSPGVLTGSAPNQYNKRDPFARLSIVTSDTSMPLEVVPENPSGTGVGDNDLADIGIWVNGVYNQTVLFNTATLVKASSVITLPAGTNKLVEFEERAHITGLTGNFNVNTESGPAHGIQGVVYGDSIPCGFRASPFYAGAIDLVRHRTGGQWVSLINYSLSGRALRDDFLNFGASGIATKLLARLTRGTTKIIWIELGTNDYGLNASDAATFGTRYAAVLDAIHSQDASVFVYCQMPITRLNETNNNSFGPGNALPDFRNQITTAVSTRTSFCKIVATRTYTLSDGVHPTTAGHAAYAADILAELGLITPAVSSTSSVTATVLSPTTKFLKSKLRADKGVSSSGGSPDVITSVTDFGSLGSSWNVGTHKPEKTTFNAHPAIFHNPATNPEYLSPALASSNFKFTHGDGFTGIWCLQRIAAAVNGRLFDTLGSGTASNVGLQVIPVDSNRSLQIFLANGSGTLVISVTTASNKFPVLGTTCVLDLRWSVANGFTGRINKVAFSSAVALVGTPSTANPLGAPTLGAFLGGTVGANQYTFEQQLHNAYLSDADTDRIVDQLTADWIP